MLADKENNARILITANTDDMFLADDQKWMNVSAFATASALQKMFLYVLYPVAGSTSGANGRIFRPEWRVFLWGGDEPSHLG